METFTQLFEQLVDSGNINLIIGGALVVLAIVALVWMYSWFQKTKEYKSLLKSIDDKVESCTKEEVLNIIRAEEEKKKEEKETTETLQVNENDNVNENVNEKTCDQKKVVVNFNRAAAAIENLENNAVSSDEPIGKEDEEPVPVIEKIQFDRSGLEAALENIHNEENACLEKEEPEQEENIDEIEEECEVDVFDEIRKMLVETEKNSPKGMPTFKKEDTENVARSGKEYTREELEKLIKF